MNCRLCNTKIEKSFLSLGNSPLANSFVKEEDLYKKEEYYPLDVYVCSSCKLVQVMDYVSSDVIFNPNYIYFSSFSKTWVEHCKNYVDMIVKRLNLNDKSKILEIGSNDGTLLQYFKNYNIPSENIIGVDPAKDCANEASKKGITTHMFMFNDHYVKNVIGNSIMDLIIGNNVFAHNPNLNEFVQSMKCILKPDGVITLEFPHLLNLIKYNQFDTFYHEHFSYFSFKTASILLNHNGLSIFDVEEVLTHGGSLRIYIKHSSDITKYISNSVWEMFKKEEDFGLNNVSTYHEFADTVMKTKRDILKLLIHLKENNKRIVAYGAPAKFNTLLNYCGTRNDFINYTVDMNPFKQGKYLPGTHIPIYSPDKIKEDKPNYIIIAPWNIKYEIVKQLEHTMEWGCKLITLIPNILITDS